MTDQLSTAPSRHTISHRIEPHLLRDRIRGKLLFVPATVSFLLALRSRSRRTELWIGDSHAMCVNREVTNSMFMRGPDRILILRAGARLMYSLASSGFPPRVTRVAHLVRRFGRPGAFVPIFSAGEIDIRVHLPEQEAPDYAFVGRYVDQCMELARVLKADRAGFFVPTPPVDVPEEDTWFPINGSIEQRVAVHTHVRDALAEAVQRHPEAVLLDFTDVLTDATGSMPIWLTTDGAHTNAEAIARVRGSMAERRPFAG